MKIIEKFNKRIEDHYRAEGVTIAFIGDSVTEGCFELYKIGERAGDAVYDKMSSYEMGVFEILATLYPDVPVNIINAGVSGDTAPWGLERIDSHVIRHQPDLCVVCYGLNDCGLDPERPERYRKAITGIFDKLEAAGIEILFMTPNMMNTNISPYITDPFFKEIAEAKMSYQVGGYFDKLIEIAREECEKRSIPVCDCYAIWKRLYESGVNITELLSNKINHPTRAMNKMFAYELVKCMFEK
jgi:lysophospholipase L1-like esterase